MLFFANRDFVLDKYTKPNFCSIPTAAELREALRAGAGSDARAQIALIFDEDTFVEIGTYTNRGFSDFISTEKTNELEGVICGYGAIDGKLTFAFVEDSTRMGGAIDDRHAKKIAELYKLALKNGAPVIGVFNSKGTDVFEGTAALAAYGKIITCVNRASGVIPQIAYVAGKCIGTTAAIAAMFDIVVKAEKAELYVNSSVLTGNADAQNAIVSYVGSEEQCAGYVKSLISFLPSNSSIGPQCSEICADNLNRKLGNLDFAGDALSAISVIADNGMFLELGGAYAPVASTVFTTIGGVKCGVVATSFSKNEGRIDADMAKKISKFVNFCNSFSIPVITLVDSLGLATDNASADFSTSLAKLAFAYAGAPVPKITVVLGHAVGASFVLLGSKSLGADLVYALSSAEIGALAADSGVAFAWNDYISLEQSRDALIAEWKANVSSPSVAAASGEIDDIISTNELRARICSALLMLADKGKILPACRKILPL